jgi:hypothetical protein
MIQAGGLDPGVRMLAEWLRKPATMSQAERRICELDGFGGFSIPEDMTGEKFGMLTVLGDPEPDQGHGLTWLCECDCGQRRRVRQWNLTAGKSTSCGCQRGKYKRKGKQS